MKIKELFETASKIIPDATVIEIQDNFVHFQFSKKYGYGFEDLFIPLSDCMCKRLQPGDIAQLEYVTGSRYGKWIQTKEGDR